MGAWAQNAAELRCAMIRRSCGGRYAHLFQASRESFPEPSSGGESGLEKSAFENVDFVILGC